MAQEAHEAIRPTDLALDPETIKGKLSIDQYKLYQLIYRRFVASQMTPAVFAVTNVVVEAGEGLFKTQGKILKFDGYRRVLAAGRQAGRSAAAARDGRRDARPPRRSTRPSTSPSRRPVTPRRR